jgi:hypothetical protein
MEETVRTSQQGIAYTVFVELLQAHLLSGQRYFRNNLCRKHFGTLGTMVNLLLNMLDMSRPINFLLVELNGSISTPFEQHVLL